MPKISELPSVASPTTDDTIPLVDSGTTSKATLGSLPISTATQAALNLKTTNSAAAITGGTITGITDLAVADGGTGASTAADARANLGAAASGANNDITSLTALTAGGLPNGSVLQADLATGVAGTGPAFSAYRSTSQAITNGLITKVQCQTEEFDTANCYDNATNYRFTPNVAGYYLITGATQFNGSGLTVLVTIYKNGAEIKRGTMSGSAADSGRMATVSALVQMNGTTDYVELWCYYSGGSTLAVEPGAALTYFQGHLARAA
jgi:hypothetical protein